MRSGKPSCRQLIVPIVGIVLGGAAGVASVTLASAATQQTATALPAVFDVTHLPPLLTMPGEQVAHVYQGPMQAETIHFIDAVALDRPVLVTPEQARQVMEVTHAADLSAERNSPVTLPLE